MIKKLSYLLASVFGIGRLPAAPGTWGSLAGLGLCAVLQGNMALYITAFAVIFAAGVAASGIVEKNEGAKDPSSVVIDEFICILPVFFLIPFKMPYIIIGFIAYRLFDILKPPPCKRIERLSGGWGIMLDDLVAGIYTNLLLHLIKFLKLF